MSRPTSKIVRPITTHQPTQKRRSYRKPVVIQGEVSLGSETRRIECKVIDMSASGARLQLCQEHCVSGAGHDCLTEHCFDLYLDRRGTNVACQVMWSGQEEIGVRFRSAIRVA